MTGQDPHSTMAVVQRLGNELLGVRPEKFAMSASFRRDLRMDSLDLVEIAVALEEELHIDIGQTRLNQIDTVGDLVEAADERLANIG